MGPKSKITIKEVAERAGVSISTVSRVLNNPDSVTDKKRYQVRRVIEELHYNPDPAAQALSNRAFKTIAVIVPNIINPVMSLIVRGIIHSLDKKNFDVLLYDTEEDFEREQQVLTGLIHKMVDGLIVVAGSGKEISFTDIAKRIPVVLIDRSENISQVDKLSVDDREGMGVLVGHLAERGYTRIALINGAKGNISANLRARYFKQALEERQLQFDPDRIVHTGWTLAYGKIGLNELLRRDPAVDAVICATDLIGMGVMHAAAERGIRVPEDLGVTGFDNSPMGEFVYPPLTTLQYPSIEMGKESVRAILRRFNNPHASLLKICYSLPLIARQSTGHESPGDQNALSRSEMATKDGGLCERENIVKDVPEGS